MSCCITKNYYSPQKKRILLLHTAEIRRKTQVRQPYCNLYAYGANNPVRYIDPDGENITNKTNDYIIARLEDPIILKDGTKIDTVVLAPGDTYIGNVDGTRDKDGNYTKISCREGNKIDYSVKTGNQIEFDNDSSKRQNSKNDKLKKINNLPLINLIKGKKLLSGSYSKDSEGGKFLTKEWDNRFKADLGEDFTDYEKAYFSETQKKLREERVISAKENEK